MLLDITHFGASTGRDCSTFITAAIDAANSGDTVLVPHGGTFLTRPFNVTKSGIVLQVDGLLRALVDTDAMTSWPRLPPLPTYGRDRDGAKPLRHQALILIFGVQHFALRGHGTIDGQGPHWWNASQRNSMRAGRPHLVEVHSSSHVEVCGVTLVDSPFWTLHLYHSERIHVHNLTIRVGPRAPPAPSPRQRHALYEGMAPLWAPNTDGIDPDSCKHVLIEHCDILCGDDHIAIKSGMNAFAREHAPEYAAVNLTIRHNTFRVGMGVSVGSETAGGVRDVWVHHNTFLGDGSFSVALHVKSAAQRGGTVERVAFTHNDVSGTTALMRLGRFGTSQKPAGYKPTALRSIEWAHNVFRPLGRAKPVRSKFMCPGQCAGIRVANNSLPDSARWQCVDVELDGVGPSQRGLEGSACDTLRLRRGSAPRASARKVGRKAKSKRRRPRQTWYRAS